MRLRNPGRDREFEILRLSTDARLPLSWHKAGTSTTSWGKAFAGNPRPGRERISRKRAHSSAHCLVEVKSFPYAIKKWPARQTEETTGGNVHETLKPIYRSRGSARAGMRSVSFFSAIAVTGGFGDSTLAPALRVAICRFTRSSRISTFRFS